MTYYSVIMHDAPQAYYRLNEASGTVMTDASSNASNGTLAASGITYSQTGAIQGEPNKALLFDGVAGDGVCPAGLDPSVWAGLTLEYWVKPTTTTLPTSPATIGSDLVQSANKGIVNYLNTTATNLNFALGTGAANTVCSAGFTFASGTWYHVCSTWDGANMKVYVNAVVKGGPTAFVGPIGATTNAISIGHNTAGTDFLPGAMDEIAIYSKALTADQVLSHYNAGIASLILRQEHRVFARVA